MNAATVAALCTGIAGVLGSVTALLGVLFHRHDPPGPGHS